MNRNLNYRLKRKYGTKRLNKIIYIFTEGEKTEVNYFESKKEDIEREIRRRNIKIKIIGTGYNTLSLVKYAEDFIGKQDFEVDNDECWVVFDKDSFDKDFNNAINKATAKNLNVAYSNESFELWYLLHFCYQSSAITRSDYILKLTDNLKRLTGDKKIKYSKNLENIYSFLKGNEKNAVKNAKKLLSIYKNKTSFSKNNPSTTVYLLVESLNKLK